jgi:hypothetical protein
MPLYNPPHELHLLFNVYSATLVVLRRSASALSRLLGLPISAQRHRAAIEITGPPRTRVIHGPDVPLIRVPRNHGGGGRLTHGGMR